ncbi:putative proteasome inhibitor [Nymphaea thermarum]|nr:putative proteasome inhibitor [Nymphaea thermarum]
MTETRLTKLPGFLEVPASSQDFEAVIRASRPSFRNDQDKVAFLAHASFLSADYVLTAARKAALGETPIVLKRPRQGGEGEDGVDAVMTGACGEMEGGDGRRTRVEQDSTSDAGAAASGNSFASDSLSIRSSNGFASNSSSVRSSNGFASDTLSVIFNNYGALGWPDQLQGLVRVRQLLPASPNNAWSTHNELHG